MIMQVYNAMVLKLNFSVIHILVFCSMLSASQLRKCVESFNSRYKISLMPGGLQTRILKMKSYKIAVNGPRLAHCETVITEATDMHWSSKSKDGLGDWHFFRTIVLSYERLKKHDKCSEVIDRILVNVSSQLNFTIIKKYVLPKSKCTEASNEDDLQ